MKVTIECTEAQLRLISAALDVYSRLGIGQIEAIKTPAHKIITNWDDFYRTCEGFKREIFGLHPYGSYGIHQDEVGKTPKMTYDMLQVIRHELWKLEENPTKHTVDSHEPFYTCDELPIKVEIEK